jgi:serine/threonine-protein kinase
MRPVLVPLTPGTRLCPYEIAAQIGAGGMGEKICRALDTNLERQVAIKILPDCFAHDVERLTKGAYFGNFIS